MLTCFFYLINYLFNYLFIYFQSVDIQFIINYFTLLILGFSRYPEVFLCLPIIVQVVCHIRPYVFQDIDVSLTVLDSKMNEKER